MILELHLEMSWSLLVCPDSMERQRHCPDIAAWWMEQGGEFQDGGRGTLDSDSASHHHCECCPHLPRPSSCGTGQINGRDDFVCANSFVNCIVTVALRQFPKIGRVQLVCSEIGCFVIRTFT